MIYFIINKNDVFLQKSFIFLLLLFDLFLEVCIKLKNLFRLNMMVNYRSMINDSFLNVTIALRIPVMNSIHWYFR